MQYEQVKELISIFEKTDLTDMEVQLGDARVHLNRGNVQKVATVSSTPVVSSGVTQAVSVTEQTVTNVTETQSVQPMTEEAVLEGTKVIKAPIVGTFYQSSAPDEAPFVKVGDTINEGDVVCIIEAMKFMNEVNSEVSGTITEILVKDGEFVEYGQELFRIK